jgi:hypothetical protein
VDYYETARANQPNYLESLVNKEYSERLASSYVHVWSPSAQDTNWKHRFVFSFHGSLTKFIFCLN